MAKLGRPTVYQEPREVIRATVPLTLKRQVVKQANRAGQSLTEYVTQALMEKLAKS